MAWGNNLQVFMIIQVFLGEGMYQSDCGAVVCHVVSAVLQADSYYEHVMRPPLSAAPLCIITTPKSTSESSGIMLKSAGEHVHVR